MIALEHQRLNGCDGPERCSACAKELLTRKLAEALPAIRASDAIFIAVRNGEVMCGMTGRPDVIAFALSGTLMDVLGKQLTGERGPTIAAVARTPAPADG